MSNPLKKQDPETNHKKPQRDTVASLRIQLKEAIDTLSAIRAGEVDALVIHGPHGDQVYTLETADHPYRILVQQMNEGAAILSKDGFVLYTNPRFTDLVSASSEQLTTTSLQSLLVPTHRDLFNSALHRAVAGEAVSLEVILCSERDKIPAQISLSPLLIESMETVCAIITDLRERKRNERLEHAAILARSILDHANAAMFITDSKGRVIHANTAAEILAGGSLTSRYLSEALPIRITGTLSLSNLIETALQGNAVRNLEGCIGEGQARAVDVLVSVGPFRLGDGEISGAVFTCSDVTAMGEAQRAIRESEERFRVLAETLPAIVWSATKEGQLDYANSRALEFFGKSQKELVNSPSGEIHPEDVDRVMSQWMECVKAGVPWECEYRMRNKDGDYRWFLSRAIPLRDEFGNILHWLGTSTDVDSQKRVENELRRANADLEQFAYAASHDFREPLRAVSTFTQLLRETYPEHADPSTSFYMDQIVDGSNRISALLSNLMTYIQASRDNSDLRTIVDCNEAFQEALENLRQQIASTGARVTTDSLPNVLSTRVHMVQVLQNLISNGIKYRGAEPPRIHVSAQERGGEWLFSVTDNGMGIPREYHKEIFGVFKRLHGSKIQGTGIGLAICERIIERYGGRIWVESEMGKGSQFFFTITAVMPPDLHFINHGNVAQELRTGAD